MEKVYFKTSDINLASTLLTLGYSIDGTYLKDTLKGEYEFYFEESNLLRDAIEKYWNKELVVEPNSVFTSRKELLNKIKHAKGFEK